MLYPTPRPIVTTIERDTLAFREKGRRKVFRLLIADAARWAVRCEAARLIAEKKARKKLIK